MQLSSTCYNSADTHWLCGNLWIESVETSLASLIHFVKTTFGFVLDAHSKAGKYKHAQHYTKIAMLEQIRTNAFPPVLLNDF